MESTAAFLLIGKEFLSTQNTDLHSKFLNEHLQEFGIKLCCVIVFEGDIVELAEEVKRLSEKYMWVFTSGGIGPFCRDVTYAAIAKAFEKPLICNNEIYTVISKYCPELQVVEPEKNLISKLASIPMSSNLHYLQQNNNITTNKDLFREMPIVSVNNVYIFPGALQSFKYMMMHATAVFSNINKVYHRKSLYLNMTELSVANAIDEAESFFSPNAVLYAFPVDEHNFCFTKIVIESESVHIIQEVEQFLQDRLPVFNYNPFCVDVAVYSVYKLILTRDERLSSVVDRAVKVLELCFERYSLDEIFLSFNGGKDCTVLLHLVYAVLQKLNLCKNSDKKLIALYIKPEDPFPEVDKFIHESVCRYNLELMTVSGPVKLAVQNLLDERPLLQSCLLGTRRTDPYADKLENFQITDEGWPKLMRVSPLLDWSYHDVWLFLQKLAVPYCRLYDVGYTSLGDRKSTTPNPELQYRTSDGKNAYKPAHLLQNPDSERSGRC